MVYRGYRGGDHPLASVIFGLFGPATTYFESLPARLYQLHKRLSESFWPITAHNVCDGAKSAHAVLCSLVPALWHLWVTTAQADVFARRFTHFRNSAF